MKFALMGRQTLLVHLRFVFCGKVFVVLLGVFSFFAIVLAQPLSCFTVNTRNVDSTLYFLLLLAFIVATNFLNSIHRYPSLHELSHNLRSRCSFGIFFDDIVHDLTICHSGLRVELSTTKQEGERKKEIFECFHKIILARDFATHPVCL